MDVGWLRWKLVVASGAGVAAWTLLKLVDALSAVVVIVRALGNKSPLAEPVAALVLELVVVPIVLEKAVVLVAVLKSLGVVGAGLAQGNKQSP